MTPLSGCSPPQRPYFQIKSRPQCVHRLSTPVMKHPDKTRKREDACGHLAVSLQGLRRGRAQGPPRAAEQFTSRPPGGKENGRRGWGGTNPSRVPEAPSPARPPFPKVSITFTCPTKLLSHRGLTTDDVRGLTIQSSPERSLIYNCCSIW